MGGNLTNQENTQATPSFLISAIKDPSGANLDRLQMVKGWINKDGIRAEKLFDVAWSDNRSSDGNGEIPDLESTVDIGQATYDNSVGGSELSVVWKDPSFDASIPAVYYVRVLEIETPRWTTYDAVQFDLNLPKDIPAVVKERAYPARCWYTP